ncbi:MAG: 30S ribosomal protein S1, partial [Proteobacteria bacterium]|nr:30S ribosomal protein S1 [Pseudomonadota bacterium]
MAKEASATSVEDIPTTGENFAELLQESLSYSKGFEGRVVKGLVIDIENDMALIDVGLKSEGRVALEEFAQPGQTPEIKVGDVVDVYVERMEDKNGESVLSRKKARREEAWNQLEESFRDNQRVTGVIFGRVKGGYTVDLSGATAFLPASQVDVRPVRDIAPFIGSPHQFQILKMDRQRGNIVVSRRAVLEEARTAQRAELIAGLKEGQVIDGVVKNITDYGAFVDLGGVDGLLHVTDIAWRRINHPSDALQIGQTVKVQVIRFNPETQRISLGMKQLQADPWEGVEAKYPVGTRFKGRVTNITDYGAFLELEPGVEGLIHVSEMSWTKKNVHPGKIVSTSQEVEVTILDVDIQRRRVSLSIKKCLENPWTVFAEEYPIGSELEGDVKNTTEFGLFIGLPGNIDGMAHLSDLDWSRPGEEAIADYKKGQRVKVKVLDIDLGKERVSLGIKQLALDPFEAAIAALKKGDIVTCTVAAIRDDGINVTLAQGANGFIRKAELSRDRSEQRPDHLAVGEKVDAKITSIDRKAHKINLSIKAHEIQEEKQAMAQYGSSDSGASLGGILGAAMTRARAQQAGEDEAGPVPEARDEAESAPEAAPEARDETGPVPEAAPEARDEAGPAPESVPEAAPEARDEAESAPEAAPEARDETEPAPEAAPEAGDEAGPVPEAAPEARDEAEAAGSDEPK